MFSTCSLQFLGNRGANLSKTAVIQTPAIPKLVGSAAKVGLCKSRPAIRQPFQLLFFSPKRRFSSRNSMALIFSKTSRQGFIRIRWTYGPDEGYLLGKRSPISLQTGFSRKIIDSNIPEGWGYLILPTRVTPRFPTERA